MNDNQSLHILKSYLEACDIPYNMVENQLYIKNFIVKMTEKASFVDSNNVFVNSKDISSSDMCLAMDAFHFVTSTTGFGKPTPVNRGENLNRVNYRDDFESVYLRHSAFRRSPDFKNLNEYNTLITKVARNAIRKYNFLMNTMGFSLEDLVNIGRVHTITFMHHYAYNTNKADNDIILAKYLKQRFKELFVLTYKKGLNSSCLDIYKDKKEWIPEIFLNSVQFNVAANGDEIYQEAEYELFEKSGKTDILSIQRTGLFNLTFYLNGRYLPEFEYKNIVNKIQNKSLFIRTIDNKSHCVVNTYKKKMEAKKELFDKLDSMEEETRNIILTNIISNNFSHPDAKALAKKICSDLFCRKCNKKSVSEFCNKCGTKTQSRYRAEIPVKIKKTSKTVELAPAKPPVPKANSIEIEQEAQKMIKAFYDKLSNEIFCPRCKNSLPKDSFRLAVSKRHPNGMPRSIRHASYCVECFRNYAKERNQ